MFKRTYKKRSKTPEDEASKSQKNLEVTGVSRSGRVRKKSSKLVGYDSGAEEHDKISKKKGDLLGNSQARLSGQYKKVPKLHLSFGDNSMDADEEVNFSESDQEFSSLQNPAAVEESSDDTLESELDDVVEDMQTDDTPKSSNMQTSLYMLEKSKRERDMRGRKTGRKDKGKARFSAYMLWARQIRPQIMNAHPGMDFSQLSSRLSELWGTVPFIEKDMWKRKAKRLALLAKQNANKKDDVNMAKQQLMKTAASKRSYINRKSILGKDNKNRNIFQSSSTMKGAATPTNTTGTNIMDPIFSMIDTQPLDVAGYLKLLGECLTTIGEKLKRHQGPIASFGSLSVLLDALLCSLGPLLCLTQQVVELNCIPQELLESIMDKITIIMPGLC